MHCTRLGLVTASVALSVLSSLTSAAAAEKKYDPGANDTEIRIGNTIPYSGPASAYAVIAQTEAAYFAKINEDGGINGRKIKFISYDDATSPPKTVEQARRLVESDEVLLIFSSLGTQPNAAIQKYLNSKQVPQLFLVSGASRWNNPKEFPWTMGWQPSYQDEARLYAQFLMKERPGAKIAVLYQNDDFGRDYLKGLKDGLGEKSAMVVAEEKYDLSEPTIDSHIVTLKASGADVIFEFANPKFAAQAIKKIGELDWKPLQIVTNVSSSIASVIRPAGLQHARGIMSVAFVKDGADPQWDNDPGMKKFYQFLERYYRDANKSDALIPFSYSLAQTLVKVLEMCGDDLTRENVMKQAANLRDFAPDTIIPGVFVNTSATDYAPVKKMRMVRFDGEKWEFIGEATDGDSLRKPTR
ncbi:ABC transporter substrate-binding protein [Bradyrhizobium pachyrhizi]|uniref:ABC transporter substrate-binding protein n=1 Tax=Bradyrhizobium pachyrhizi TaxID=280333 RepID=UPI00067CE578|nr:ABC transporter substrate-binding protein [Bradyrhizobium pachyrhizi]